MERIARAITRQKVDNDNNDDDDDDDDDVDENTIMFVFVIYRASECRHNNRRCVNCCCNDNVRTHARKYLQSINRTFTNSSLLTAERCLTSRGEMVSLILNREFYTRITAA